MSIDTESTMTFEWKHTHDDHLAVTEYQFLYTSMSELGVASRRRTRLIIFLMVCIPLAILFIANLGQQNIVSVLGTLGIMGFLYYFVVTKDPNPKALKASTKKIAKRYIDGMCTIPIGTHQLLTDGHYLEWRWVDGGERSSYPISRIEGIRESDARLFILRRGEVGSSIPFHAFGDQESRLKFVQLIEETRKAKDNE